MKKKQRKWKRKNKNKNIERTQETKSTSILQVSHVQFQVGVGVVFCCMVFENPKPKPGKKTKSERTKILKQTGCLFFSTNQNRSKKGKPFQNRIPTQHSFLGNFSAYDKCCGAKIFGKKDRHLQVSCSMRASISAPKGGFDVPPVFP